jgi:hypothetical protein
VSRDNLTISDVAAGGANFMLGVLQMTIVTGESITAEKWQKALDETLAFQQRMIERQGGAQ